MLLIELQDLIIEVDCADLIFVRETALGFEIIDGCGSMNRYQARNIFELEDLVREAIDKHTRLE